MSIEYNNNSGNVLFLILIAVALFAALSYAGTSSSRTGGGSADTEKAQTEASALLSYATGVRTAYQRMKISNGCSFFNQADQNPFVGNPAIYPGKCNIYDAKEGGGVVYNAYPSSSPLYTKGTTTSEGKNTFFVTMWVNGVGTSIGSESEMIIFNINPNICKAVNKILGITTTDGQPPLEDSPYEGGFGGGVTGCCSDTNDSVAIGHANGAPNELSGKMEGCYRAARGANMGHHFYTVLDSN